MSSLAIDPRTRPRRVGRAGVDLLERRGSDVILAVAVIGFAVALLAFVPGEFNVDSWLALVTGRELWAGGIPHHEVLTAMAHGHVWIDQQWLSQLCTYGLYLIGGFGLVGVTTMLLIAASVAGAVIGARRLGAPPRAVLIALPLGLWLVGYSHEVRTQEFVLPLFVACAYLLARDSRAPSRRIYWCLPMLVLWANLHGSATLGAFLVILRGATVAWERRGWLLRDVRAWWRPLALVLGPIVCLLATPYGFGILDYYRTMLLGSPVMHSVTEWQPVTSIPAIAAGLLISAGLAIWCFGRDSSRTTPWERIALLALAAGSVDVIRNVLFFGLLALIVLPLALRSMTDAPSGPAARGRGVVNAALIASALGALVLAATVTLVRPATAIEFRNQRQGVLTAVERATHADRSLKVLADVRFSDWLLWRDPALAGRIANDARWELLTPRQVDGLQAVFGVAGAGWKQGARGYRLLVLDRRYEPDAVRAFRKEPGSHVLYNDGDRIVIMRSAREAGLSHA
jgi:hypothetical protein